LLAVAFSAGGDGGRRPPEQEKGPGAVIAHLGCGSIGACLPGQ
jgi:hypothetical protein